MRILDDKHKSIANYINKFIIIMIICLFIVLTGCENKKENIKVVNVEAISTKEDTREMKSEEESELIVELQNNDIDHTVIIYEYGDVESYFAKKLKEPTDENIKNYVLELGKYMKNAVVETMDQYENDKYLVFQISEKEATQCDANIVCCWEKGNANGGAVLDKWNTQIDGWLMDKYLVIDSGTFVVRSKTICDMSLDMEDENFYQQLVIASDIYTFDNTSWIMYSTQTENSINNMKLDPLCSVVLYNLETKETILYKEAKDNYAWRIEDSESDKVAKIIKMIGNEDNEITETVEEEVNLRDWHGIVVKQEKWQDFLMNSLKNLEIKQLYDLKVSGINLKEYLEAGKISINGDQIGDDRLLSNNVDYSFFIDLDEDGEDELYVILCEGSMRNYTVIIYKKVEGVYEETNIIEFSDIIPITYNDEIHFISIDINFKTKFIESVKEYTFEGLDLIEKQKIDVEFTYDVSGLPESITRIIDAEYLENLDNYGITEPNIDIVDKKNNHTLHLLADLSLTSVGHRPNKWKIIACDEFTLNFDGIELILTNDQDKDVCFGFKKYIDGQGKIYLLKTSYPYYKSGCVKGKELKLDLFRINKNSIEEVVSVNIKPNIKLHESNETETKDLVKKETSSRKNYSFEEIHATLEEHKEYILETQELFKDEDVGIRDSLKVDTYFYYVCIGEREGIYRCKIDGSDNALLDNLGSLPEYGISTAAITSYEQEDSILYVVKRLRQIASRSEESSTPVPESVQYKLDKITLKIKEE